MLAGSPTRLRYARASRISSLGGALMSRSPRKRGAFFAERFRGVKSCGVPLSRAGPEEQRLGDIARRRHGAAVQVGERPREPQHAVEAARAELAPLQVALGG